MPKAAVQNSTADAERDNDVNADSTMVPRYGTVGRRVARVVATLALTLLAGGLAAGVVGAATNSRPFTETTADFMKSCMKGGGEVSNAINTAGDVTVSCTRTDKSVETCNFTSKMCTTTPPPRRVSDFGVAAPTGGGALTAETGGSSTGTQTGANVVGGENLAADDDHS
jgi:hypothetical protein